MIETYHPSTVLLTAIYDRLQAYPQTSSYNVYRSIPKDVEFPFIKVGGASSFALHETWTTTGWEGTIPIEARNRFERGHGSAATTNAMVSGITRAFSSSVLTLTDWDISYQRVLDTDDVHIEDEGYEYYNPIVYVKFILTYTG